MHKRLTHLIAALALLCTPFIGAAAGAHNSRPDPREDPDLQCVTIIYTSLHEVGDRCFATKDTAVQAEISTSIERIQGYIVANSAKHVTRADLEAERALYLKRLRSEIGSQSICDADAIQLYEAARREGIATIRANIDELLSPQHKTEGACL